MCVCFLQPVLYTKHLCKRRTCMYLQSCVTLNTFTFQNMQLQCTMINDMHGNDTGKSSKSMIAIYHSCTSLHLYSFLVSAPNPQEYTFCYYYQ